MQEKTYSKKKYRYEGKNVGIGVYPQKGKKQPEGYFAIERKKCIIKECSTRGREQHHVTCSVIEGKKHPP
jgi:hypothetical protein